MAVAFQPGQTLQRGDLDIFLTDADENATNAAEITFALYFVDPGPPETEVLIGAAQRTPINPAVGEYYASLMVPPTAVPGKYRIRWTFKQFVNSMPQQVVQEFNVSAPSNLVVTKYSPAQQEMIHKLRVLLRDQCVGGEEIVELDVEGERMLVSLGELYQAISRGTIGV